MVNFGFSSMTPDEQRKADRAKQEWEPIAKEPLMTAVISGAYYAFGSELACLRLEHKMKTGRAAYSENMKSWYYCNE